VLLRDAHDRFGLPGTVLRPNMILAHRRWAGQINVPDMFTRLLFSLVETGLAPASFYDAGPAHYDGTPVDVLARAMVAIALGGGKTLRVFNTINHLHDDGISLDSFAGWVESAGYPLHRMTNHADWHARFTEKLRQLPDERRRHSSIDLVDFFARPLVANGLRVDTTGFAGVLATVQPPLEIPHLDEGFIHKYLADMVLLGLLPQPAADALLKAV
jgi:fatty acid CoA ligase FadD9